MDAANNQAVPKTYIAEWIKLDFSNDSNLKADIQGRISDNTSEGFIDALNHIKGDNKNGDGSSFSEVTLWALAYFHSEIFKDEIKDSYYSLEMVKGLLDANNFTTYTAIHEINVPFCKLKDAPLFRHCWLIIQSAWYFNSEHFGHHQHIDYINHYIITEHKLPSEHYNYDQSYLEKKYGEIDKEKKRSTINGFTYVLRWYYGILFLVCKELQLPTTYFNVTVKDNREFNPLTQTSRQLRPLAPFKITECDIKSAFPTFLDAFTRAKLKDAVYNNLMNSLGISRSEAKIKFNTICNSGKYMSKSATADFFRSCGYEEEHIGMLLYLTHNNHLKFYQFMTRQEEKAIKRFVYQNGLQRGTRLHDAVLLIDNKVKPQILKVEPNCDFGYKEMNSPVIKEHYSISNKRLPYAYISSIPKGLKLIAKHDDVKPAIKGEANGFRFYKSSYSYISARFNLNNYFALKDNDPKEFFLRNCETMLSTLKTLNERNITPLELEMILKHIRSSSNFVFNVRALFLRLMKFNYDPNLVTVKTRDYDLIGNQTFKKNIDYLNAMNNARKRVNTTDNYHNLAELMQERITNDDYGYLNEALITGHKRNNSLIYAIIKNFNLLCTGLHRQRRKQVKSEPLCYSVIKGLLLKSLSLKPQQQNAFIQKGIKKYEREIKVFNRLINNRLVVQQLLLVILEIAGLESDMAIIKDEKVIMRLKAELLAEINKAEGKSIEDDAKEFDLLYKSKDSKAIEPISDQSSIFSSDLSNSIFNNITIEDANAKDEVFFNEYLKFHEIDKDVEGTKLLIKPSDNFEFPEIDF